MKLFITAMIIGACSAARLEHLERGYLPPDHGPNSINGPSSFSGPSSFGNPASAGPSSFASRASFGGSSGGSFGGASSFGGPSGSSFNSGSPLSAKALKQYLPPDHGPSSGNGNGFGLGSRSSFGTSSQNQQYRGAQQFPGSTPEEQTPFGAQPTGQFGQSPNGNQYGQASSGLNQQYGQASSGNQQYGLASSGNQQYGQASNGQSQQYGQASSGLSQQYGQPAQYNAPGQFGPNAPSLGAAGRQYLAPKTTSSFDNIPQQAFDEETGYHY